MASAVNPLTGTSASSSAASSSSSSSSASSLSAPSEEMFLQLLVAQLKNQDPLNPTDSTQFVSQLAQFSELEQVIAIRGDIESYAAKSDAATAASSTDPTTTSGTSSNSPATNT
jgi:flagellar basal-body rod modification protein FlgD